jgi:MinD superfamily P-loop ATPase
MRYEIDNDKCDIDCKKFGWCMHVCDTGAIDWFIPTEEFNNNKLIFQELCDDCGQCISFCKSGAIKRHEI